MRPSWDEYFLTLCNQIATRSTCDRLHVGAVLVGPEHNIISTGYNGSLRGEPHCDDPETYWECKRCGCRTIDPLKPNFAGQIICQNITDPPGNPYSGKCNGVMEEKHGGHDIVDSHCVRTIHAESNCITQAARHGISTNGCTLFCNWLPCWPCYKIISSAGVSEIVYQNIYKPDSRVEKAASRGEVKIRQVKL